VDTLSDEHKGDWTTKTMLSTLSTALTTDLNFTTTPKPIFIQRGITNNVAVALKVNI